MCEWIFYFREGKKLDMDKKKEHDIGCNTVLEDNYSQGYNSVFIRIAKTVCTSQNHFLYMTP